MRLTNFDMSVLRTLQAGVELGSFAKAAAKLGRSPSAISLQLRKLEEQAGQPLFRKDGRGLTLTEAGETMLSYARRLLDLNDEAVMALHSPAIAGSVRLGLPQDFAETLLPSVLGRFTRVHPKVRVDVWVDRNAALLEGIANGSLDLALVWGEELLPNSERLADLSMAWVAPPKGFIYEPAAALPLVLFAPPCIFRQAAMSALDAAGIPWRVALTSPSLSGLWAAVSAGLGVTCRTTEGMPPTLGPLDARNSGLPILPQIGISLCMADARPAPAAARLTAILRDAVAFSLGGTIRSAESALDANSNTSPHDRSIA